MAPVQSGMVDAVLRVARRRSPQTETAPVGPQGQEKPIRRREAQLSDWEAIIALKKRSGLSEDSRENWRRLWQENPALSAGGANLPIGWVQEAEGEIVGYLGSIPMLYQYGDRTLLAAATTSYAVDPLYRSRSLGMVGAFFRQPGCDLYLNTTATDAAGRIMRAFKAEVLPQKDYEIVLFWVLDARGFLQSVMKRLQISGRSAAILSFCGTPFLGGDILIRGRRPKTGFARRSCRELRLEEVGDDFESLWLRKLAEKPRLMAWRTPEAIRWHFRIPHAQSEPQVLACYEAGVLQGYAVVMTGLVPRMGLQKSSVADIFVAGDKPEVITELLVSAYDVAKKNQSDILEVMGFPEHIRETFLAAKPYSRSYPACPFYYKTDRAALQPLLANADSWYACPYDGDGTLHV